MKRKMIEQEVAQDLKKPYFQLLVDIHEEFLNKKRSSEDNIKHAQKRITSLFARMGYDSAKAQERMIKLTYAVVVLVIIQVCLGIILLFTQK